MRVGSAIIPVANHPVHVATCPVQAGLAVAKLEAQVSRLVELLANIISDTKGRVEKKQAQVGVHAVCQKALGSSYTADRYSPGDVLGCALDQRCY